METVEQFIARRGYPVEQLYVDTFWQSVQKRESIVLTDEIIEMIGFKGKEGEEGHQRTNCYRALRRELKEEDYEEISLEGLPLPPERQRGGHNRKYFRVKQEAFKRFLMALRTDYADDVRTYYLLIEEIFKDYLEYQADYKEKELQKKITELNKQTALAVEEETKRKAAEKDLEDERRRTGNLKLAITNMTAASRKPGFVYFGTTPIYASHGFIKAGSTTNLRRRQRDHNGSRVPGDRMRYIWAGPCLNPAPARD